MFTPPRCLVIVVLMLGMTLTAMPISARSSALAAQAAPVTLTVDTTTDSDKPVYRACASAPGTHTIRLPHTPCPIRASSHPTACPNPTKVEDRRADPWYNGCKL